MCTRTRTLAHVHICTTWLTRVRTAPRWRQVWLPFNKSILLIVTANLELARENAQRWKAWLQTVVAIAKAPRVVVAANNR